MARRWTHLLVHHTAGDPRLTVEQIRQEHIRNRKFSDIGYHYVLARPGGGQQGFLKVGRPDTQSGAHAGGPKQTKDGRAWNSFALGLSVPGYFHPGNPHSEHMDEELYRDLLAAVLHLMQKYHIPAENLRGHREVKATACPGDWFPLDRLKADVKQRLGS